MNRPLRIAVLKGGISSEREVSLLSGKAVEDALRSLGHDVRGIDITDRAMSSLNGYRPDAVFIALHGCFGEDGGAQAVLEQKGLPYTGSGINASKLAMNKVASKELFIENHVPTPEYCVVTKRLTGPERKAMVEQKLGLPVVVKPVAEGSSVGVSIVKDGAALDAAFEQAFRYGDHVLVERYIQGRELTVGILGEKALPIIELAPKREFYNYEAKYVDNDTVYIVAPEIGEECTKRVQEAALRAHKALGCSGMSRVDIMLDGTGKEYVLEVNTIPGFTSHSLLPKAAAAVGIGFPQLCEKILEMAINGNGKE